MKNLTNVYRLYFKNQKFLIAVGLGLLWLGLGLVANFYAGMYATESASNAVTDMILDNIPVFDVDIFFVYGPVLLWCFIAWFCLTKPQRIPFVLKSIALFVLIRSLFISLTHIGPFPDRIVIDYTSDLVKKFTFGGDLFFSAHTGLPFLMALVFQKQKKLFIWLVLAAIFFGIIVLLGHLHYSIDVLSAFFITYSIYHLALVLFKKDWHLFSEGLVHQN